MKLKGCEYDSEHVFGKEVKVDRKSFDRNELVFLQRALEEKFEKLLRTINPEKFKNYSECIEAGADLFPNPYLLAIAKEMAKASEQEKYISSDEIAETLKVDLKYVSNKMPFIRKILEMLGIEIDTTLSFSEENKTKTIVHKLKFAA